MANVSLYKFKVLLRSPEHALTPGIRKVTGRIILHFEEALAPYVNPVHLWIVIILVWL